MNVRYHQREDSFTIEIDRSELNMLARAIQSSPYDEVQAMRAQMVDGLLHRPEPAVDGGVS